MAETIENKDREFDFQTAAAQIASHVTSLILNDNVKPHDMGFARALLEWTHAVAREKFDFPSAASKIAAFVTDLILSGAVAPCDMGFARALLEWTHVATNMEPTS